MKIHHDFFLWNILQRKNNCYLSWFSDQIDHHHNNLIPPHNDFDIIIHKKGKKIFKFDQQQQKKKINIRLFGKLPTNIIIIINMNRNPKKLKQNNKTQLFILSSFYIIYWYKWNKRKQRYLINRFDHIDESSFCNAKKEIGIILVRIESLKLKMSERERENF